MQKSIAPSQKAPIFEHFGAGRVEFPEISFPGGSVLPRHLDEAIVQTEVMSDGILPRWPALSVIRKLLDDVVADFSQSEHFVRGLRDGHGYEGNVGVRRFDVVLIALRDGSSLLAVSILLASCVIVVAAVRSFTASISATVRSGVTGAGCGSGGLRTQSITPILLHDDIILHDITTLLCSWWFRKAVLALPLHLSLILDSLV